jgi:hypothetical protein
VTKTQLKAYPSIFLGILLHKVVPSVLNSSFSERDQELVDNFLVPAESLIGDVTRGDISAEVPGQQQ